MRTVLIFSFLLISFQISLAQHGNLHTRPVQIRPANVDVFGYRKPITAQDLKAAKKYIQFRASDEDRMKMAINIVSTNYVTTCQLMELMGLLVFDRNKLELAKEAYPKTLDQGNYFKVTNSFSFRKTGDDLMDYITTLASR